MNNKIRVAAIALMPAAIYCASVAPPTSEEVYAAIRNGDNVRIQGWIASGWHVNSTGERGNTR